MKGGKAIQGKAEIGVVEMAAMLEAFVRGISDRGKAKPGEKTIIDSLLPAVQALQEAAASGVNLSEALRMADEAACNGLENTKQFVSQHGKAAVFREKTLGKQDPGATVGMLMMKTFAEYRG
jgi:dihydroxyacetone kinase-like protein